MFLNKLLSFVGLLVSIASLVVILLVWFPIFLFGGMAPIGSFDNVLSVLVVSLIMALFITWRFIYMVQTRKHINGFILCSMLIILIVIMQIPFMELGFNGQSANTILETALGTISELF